MDRISQQNTHNQKVFICLGTNQISLQCVDLVRSAFFYRALLGRVAIGPQEVGLQLGPREVGRHLELGRLVVNETSSDRALMISRKIGH